MHLINPITKAATVAFFALMLAGPSLALQDGLARTPPMGWNPYNTFGSNTPSEKALREIADSLVSTGMRDAGYVFMGPDCGWSSGPDSKGVLQPKPELFPNGLKPLVDYVQAKGLKYFMYADIGSSGCCGKEAVFPNFDGNARQWAEWKVDYLKLDFCGGSNGLPASLRYAQVRNALKKAGRPIVYSICEWGTHKPWLWGDTVGHLWRTTLDIQARWGQAKRATEISILEILDANEKLHAYAGPGRWNDADMLEVGVGNRLSLEQQRAHFSLWCIMASPLIAGNDVRKMTPEVKSILLNKEVIAVNQDSLGVQGRKVRVNGSYEVWGAKPLKDGHQAVILFNRTDRAANLALRRSDLGSLDGKSVRLRDLWAKTDTVLTGDSLAFSVPAHGVRMFRAFAPAPTMIRPLHRASRRPIPREKTIQGRKSPSRERSNLPMTLQKAMTVEIPPK